MASLNQLCMMAFISSLERKNDEKNLSQINKSEYIEIKGAWKEAKGAIAQHFTFLGNELCRFKVYV